MAEISWTWEAEWWLKEIYNFIAQDSPSAADKIVQEIIEKAHLLTRFPEAGYKYRKESLGDIRVLLYGHYRIAYLVKSRGAIDILGVFHGALDIDKYL